MATNKLLITGGSGFVGRNLAIYLANKYEVVTPTHQECDLEKPCVEFFKQVRPTYVIHCAGYNGGIGFNQKYPAIIYQRNTEMALNLLEACHQSGVQKVMSLVSSCAYPDSGESLLKESEFFKGVPHASIACHAFAKRNLVVASRMYNEQYGLNATTICLNTIYGPGDSCDPERTKVGMAMVKRFVDAIKNKEKIVSCWGTGSPLREFVYIDDAVKLIDMAFDSRFDSLLPLNLGTGQEISIKKLAFLVSRLTGFIGEITWLANKPDGQMRKKLDLTRMNELIEYPKPISLEDGFKRTIDWYTCLS